MEKLLTIIVPSYDMEKYLPKCLGSVVGETGGKLETIVVNDGSKDRTGEIAHDFERRHPDEVRVIDKPNGHYGSAVNAGLAAASGLYVKNLDADDSFDPEGLAALLAQIEADRQSGTSVDLYLTDYDHVSERGETTCSVSFDLPTDRLFGVEEILTKTKEIFMHACAWRVGLLREIGYRQSEGVAYSDGESVLYPMLKARTIRYLPTRVYRYLLGREGQSVSLAERRKNIGACEVILDRMFTAFRTEGEELAPAARAYLLRCIIDMARLYLETAFLLASVGEVARIVPKLLSELESVRAGLGTRLENESRILTHSLNLPYLLVWRKLPVGKTLWMRLVRGYLAATRWIVTG